MKKNKLNKFVILSLAFHVVLISAVLLYFFKYPLSGGKSATVMVGVISSDDSDSAKSKSPSTEANNIENSEQESNPKIALEKKPIQQNIKNKKNIQREIQKEKVKPTKKKTESNRKLVGTSSKASDINRTRSGKETASIGQQGQIDNNYQGKNRSKNSLAYPDYNINPKPKYPRVARKRGYEGEVELKVFVLADGRVGEIKVFRPSGHKVLDDEAIEAVKDWIFIPGMQDGKEISSWVTVPITFQLKNS